MEERFDQPSAADKGFTLIELLIAIVVVGILTAVAIVGVGALVNNGTTSACNASRDAAEAAAAVHYANVKAWPADFKVMVDAGEYKLAGSDPTPAAGVLVYSHGSGSGAWTLTMTLGAGGNGPTFACS